MKKLSFFLMAMLVSLTSFAAALGEGYSKVTDITTLSAGDKVVLYCDDADKGVTGWDGNKTATAAAEGWVEYVVEAADGGVLLKDGEQYIALTARNGFYYTATGSVCKVTADGVLYITLSGTDYLLYENANNGSPVYRMYVDKTGNAQYKPVYVYEVVVAEEGGETPEPTPDPEPEPDPEPTPDPEEPGDDVTGNPAATIAAGTNGSACTVNEKDGIKVGTSSKGGSMTITVPANATALQFYAAAWNKVTDLSINITPADKVATASIELTADAGIANSTPFTLSGEEASFYYEVALNNITEETTLTVETSIAKRFVIWGVTYTAGSNEGGETPEPTPDPEEPESPVLPEGVITCAEAVAICNEVGSTATTETYTIRGYVTNIAYAYDAGYNNISFWMADTKDGGNVFQAYRSTPTADTDKAVKVGDYVEVTGQLTLYGTTPEAKQGGTYTILEAAEGEPETPVLPEFPEGPITCAQALEVCLATGTTSTTDTYTVHGYVTKIETAYSDQYQNISFYMADTKDGGNVLLAYRVKGDATVKVGDKVEVIGTLVNYSGNTPEVNSGGTYTILEVAEGGETPEPTPDPEEPETPVLPEGENVTFLASADKGNATDDYNNAGEFTVTKNNVSMTVTKGIATDHYRIYKNETLTITSAAGNIVAVQLTCTVAGDDKYGPGCLTADEGTYTYAGTVGTWIGNASSVVFTASSNQVRATQIVVILADGTTTGLDNITIDTNITKTIVNGQLIIIKDGVKYNAQGQVVK